MLLGTPFMSGVEVAILELARALSQHDEITTTFFVPARFRRRLDLSPGHIESTHLPAQSRLARIAWEQLIMPTRLRRRQVDLLHAPGYLSPLAVRRPTVLTVYDLIALNHPQWCKPANALYFRLFQPGSIRRARAIIVPSTHTADAIARRFPGLRAQVRVIPPGINAFFSSPASDAERATIRRRFPSPYILFVGSREPKKNVDGLLRAFATLRRQHSGPLQLVLAGDEGWGTPHLPRLIKQLGLVGHVHMTGYVDQVTLRALYTEAELLAFPSLTEGFGLPPLEAMRCGTPVVCSTCGALPETTGTAARRVDPTNSDALAGAMAELLAPGEQRDTMIAEGRRWTEHFTWDAAAERTVQLYHDILNPGAAHV